MFPVEDGENFSVGDDSALDLHRDEGSNLVDARPSVMVQEPTLLDLPRDPVDRWIFESYTYTGTYIIQNDSDCPVQGH